jgi:hypothetical protein
VHVHRLGHCDLGAHAVGAAITGSFQRSSLSLNNPANPPMPDSTSGLEALLAQGLSFSTASSPASMLTPAAA